MEEVRHFSLKHLSKSKTSFTLFQKLTIEVLTKQEKGEILRTKVKKLPNTKWQISNRKQKIIQEIKACNQS